MSWVAEENPSATAAIAMKVRESDGSCAAINSSEPATAS